MYCERCRLLTDGAVCPVCGRNTRQPADNDECFLIEKEMLFGEMLIDVLKQNGVPPAIPMCWARASPCASAR